MSRPADFPWAYLLASAQHFYDPAVAQDDEPESADRADASARYQFEAVLGQGGMAVVHRVLDRGTGRRVALKRLTVLRPEGREKLVALFEREYLTLAHLTHPRIVEAYDYGVDAQGPYYTMELLDGGDLQTLAPVPWRRACGLARDVCSALALLHSRRLVYRDLSPRNVRCTSDGLAKLIDFGAMTSMGPSRDLVGTLPFVPPEAVNQQPLDARTDLYALGATLYSTLVQRHAYPARDVAQLRDFWRSRPRRPSELVPDIPEALDELIMDLMHPDPAVRPANAAEVMARLGAIAGLRASEQLLVTQAYLTNPTLVGRATELSQARKLMLRAHHRRGASVMIQGAPGVGRSRLLDGCVLEAKLAGLVVLRADTADAQRGSYGVLRALADQLLRALGPATLACAEPELPLLGRAIPELVRDRPDVALADGDDATALYRREQQVLRQWLLEVSMVRPLLIAIDDLPRIDEPSAACISLLGQEIADRPIVIVTSACDEDLAASPVRAAVELLASASTTTFELGPLTLELTEQLLGSLFGDVPNLHPLARYVQAVTFGKPRDAMRLAQHLVSEGVISYRGGAWSLPATLDVASLPASMADALRARATRLSPDAQALVRAFLCEPTQTFSFDECATLAGPSAGHSAALLASLEELVAAEFLSYAGERYGLSQKSAAASILETCTPAQLGQTHLRLAELYTQRGEGFRAAAHLLKGGDLDRGLDALVAHARESVERTDMSFRAFFELVQSLPHDWLATYELGLTLCDERGRPARERDTLLNRMGGLVAHSVSETDGYAYIDMRLEQLRKDSGLAAFAGLSSTLDHGTRLKKALEEAGARYQNTPPHERVLDPGTAITQLANTVLNAMGALAFSCDYAFWRRVPSLDPFGPLSPALGVVQTLSDGLGARMIGRAEAAIERYEGLLERMAQPDGAGLTPTHLLSTQHRIRLGIGMLEAAMGRPSCLTRATQIEAESLPFYAPQAMFIRHLYYVWQGDTGEATRCRQQIEITRIETGGQYGFEGPHLLSELIAYALTDDLTRVKRATDMVEPRAAVHRAWLPVLHFGHGEYQRIRGDFEAARQAHELALSLISDGHNQIWSSLAGAHLRGLLGLGLLDEALARGTTYLQMAGALSLGYVLNYIRMPLSLVLSKVGDHTSAIITAQACIDDLVERGCTGLNLAVAYETRARVDLEAGDRDGFERHAAMCAMHWRAGEKRLMGSRYQKKTRDSLESADLTQRDEVSIVSQFTSTLDSCQSPIQRARTGLEYLGRHSGATGGLLYTHTQSGLSCAASFGDLTPCDEFDAWAAAYFQSELDDADEGTSAFSEPPPSEPPPAPSDLPGAGASRRYVPVLLTHQSQRGYAITGVALLAVAAGEPFTYPSRIAAELSRSVAGAGDVDATYV